MTISDEFKLVLRKGTFHNRFFKYMMLSVGAIVLVGISAQFIISGAKESVPPFIAMLLVFGPVYWFNRYKFKEVSFWVNVFENRPEDLVWVKPIETSHKAAYVITVAKTYKYELFLKDGTHAIIDTSYKRIAGFYKGIRKHAPHAHFGYSNEIRKLYRKDRVNFLKNAKVQGIYTSINDYDL
jgi:hypothetical protein